MATLLASSTQRHERHIHLLQSVSKSVTAATFGILVAQESFGLIHWSPITCRNFEATAYRGAMIQQLLDMTSGVHWDETYTAPDSHCAKMDVACGWKASQTGWPSTMWNWSSRCATPGAHGADFNYRSIETDVLGFVIGARLVRVLRSWSVANSGRRWSRRGRASRSIRRICLCAADSRHLCDLCGLGCFMYRAGRPGPAGSAEAWIEDPSRQTGIVSRRLSGSPAQWRV